MNASDDPPPRQALVVELTKPSPALPAMRRWIGEVFGDLSEDSVDDVRLVVTELVSNAYDHGLHPRLLRLRRLGAGLLRVEVDDASPDKPVLGRSRIDDTRGRGLVIVDKIAEAWGVTWQATGKTVWAELRCGLGLAAFA
ncbi:hypothetical protein BBK82_42615 [Lentzea guizhouensis]|uniref:Histidine kinase/HSP90-like ATPase domain-containing protein n=1 Tax=Lentzea guizhouensis TaxID=1586287 RepID=A0A1B2HVE9_9PSEU|nr:ATP-binding protein [Lentzea guizhouensis]ANZ41655.1 hypothetical protein BBK82_42615 [Lentzea guizhouensis]